MPFEVRVAQHAMGDFAQVTIPDFINICHPFGDISHGPWSGVANPEAHPQHVA